MFELTITPLLLTILGALVVSVIYILAGINRSVSSVGRRAAECTAKEQDNDDSITNDTEYPAVSVIVYACDDVDNLKILLPQLLTQDYPGRMEVIVVNDGAPSGVDEIVARLESQFSNLYLTFVPDNSRNLSRRKLALTLGIKAARFETVALTCGNCRIASRNWLREMITPIAHGKEITIGYSYLATCDSDNDGNDSYKSPLSLWKSVDTLWNTAAYLSWAIAGRPYRGICYNLAYRRVVFFRNKGFSRSLSLNYGDDDIFINEVSSRDNTAVQLSRNSMVAVMNDETGSLFKRDRLRYDFTSRFLPAGARRLFSSAAAAWWLATASAVALSLIGWPSLIPLITAVTIFLALWVATAVAWRRTSMELMLPFGWGGFIAFPLLMMLHPFYSLYYAIIGRKHRAANYTWSMTR